MFYVLYCIWSLLMRRYRHKHEDCADPETCPEAIKLWFKMDQKEKNMLVSYITGMTHATLSSLGAIYCFLYADGQPNNTWFHCNFYKLHMFEIQLYLNCFSAGYLIQDALFCTMNSKMDAMMMQTYLHHFLAIFGIWIAHHIRGFIGSIV